MHGGKLMYLLVQRMLILFQEYLINKNNYNGILYIDHVTLKEFCN